MRVVAGRFGGRKLLAPPEGVRPSTDRLREGLFEVLGDSLTGTLVVDLFCGSGALGIEALSRGAVRAIFVDDAAASLKVLRQNLGFVREARLPVSVHRSDALKFVEKHWPIEAVGCIFMDAPYGETIGKTALEAIADLHGSQVARVVFEHGSKEPAPQVAGLVQERELVYGGSSVSIYRGGF